MDPSASPEPTGSPEERPARSAGVVIIGNEILSGKVEEQNAAFFVTELRAIGVRLREVAFIEDDRAAIGATVRRMADAYDVVCTTGGIGPTHDDVTIDGVAAGLGVQVSESPELVRAIEATLGPRMLPGHRRMARIPDGAVTLPTGGRVAWPLIRLANVWIFPGIPWLVRAKFGDLARHLGSGPTTWLGALQLCAQEADIVEALDALVLRHGATEIGSYPAWSEGRWTVRLTVEGTAEAAVHAAWTDLKGTFAATLRTEEPVRPVNGAPAVGATEGQQD
ncbi:MAG: competence/damage-inducible protein A [Deltaproteobacteria bacterium HGW-Deltaproteobacteria-14]|jgi:molybdenum cofactor synthesis domain-containing protein|nr:MAG: competence/damage-inducible protein A [Deltaproteobacteria bacterium HGW-Deltaproteobacteria-14]